MNFKRDSFGYINNRGASKYWGVTTSVVEGKKRWVVSHKPKWSNVTIGHHSSSFTLSERDAAKVAEFLFEQSMYSTSAPKAVFIRTADLRNVIYVDPRDSELRRYAYRGQDVYSPTPILTLDLTDTAVVQEAPAVAKLLRNNVPKAVPSPVVDDSDKILVMLDSLKDTSFTEKELIGLVTDAILSGVLSVAGTKLLIGALEQSIR